ncbi:branched-chain amino acid transport system II carrier protein [Metabacillus sp. RGM 3146]|uniref:branched-chain amino acid transport system II carrier protein n=1 Tax=Metabacillus sp. RGM 3146 TaxID=3401092 RepID=UPI003B9D51BD
MELLRRNEIILISFMLFSMFFGAGNLIFPTYLGYSAGESVWSSMTGFIFSAVGLPVLAVIAVAVNGSFEDLNKRVHPLFALIFPIIIYLCIGPGLAIPRAGTIAYEMGMKPFLPVTLAGSPFMLAGFSLVFFAIVLWFSLSPSKLVDRFGKILAPVTLGIIALIFIRKLFIPGGKFAAPAELYQGNSFFQGFLDGYLTMDALGALVFGVFIANTVRSRGIANQNSVSRNMIWIGIGAGVLLASIYSILAYLGASVSGTGNAKNGAGVLSIIVNNLFGETGLVFLGILFILACLCVSIGLVISCSQYFHKLLPKIAYHKWVIIFTLVSMLIANLGLDQILSVSAPILSIIYPVIVVLILLGLMYPYLREHQTVYSAGIAFTGIYSVIEFANHNLLSNSLDPIMRLIPLYKEGMGWILPAIAGGLIGYLISFLKRVGVTV